jgi:hypothetical protein
MLNRKTGYTRLTLILMSVGVVLFACDPDKVMRPAELRSIRPTANHSPPRPPATSVELPIPSNSGAPLLGGAPTLVPTGGIVVRNGLNMRMRMPTSMISTYNTSMPSVCHWWWVPSGEVSPNGYQPSIQNPAYGRVYRRMTTDPGGTNSLSDGHGWNKDIATGTWTSIEYHDALPVDSAYVFLWREKLDGECVQLEGTYIKYFLSGQQQVTIDFPAVDVHADKDYVAQGGTVRFTATPVDFTPGGTFAWSWVWQGGGSSTVLTSCSGLTVCDYAPQQTGDMFVRAPHAPNLTVNGVSDSVDVLKCPTGDSLVDNPIVRQALRRALDSSYADSATNKRRERIGYIYRDTSTGTPPALQIATFAAASYTLSNACYAVASGPPPSPPFVLVAYYHTHPFTSGTNAVAADIKPSNCGPQHSGRAYRAGPSPDDWQTALNLGPVPGYIIDKDRVFRFDATHPNANNPAFRPSLTQRWPWNTAACQW